MGKTSVDFELSAYVQADKTQAIKMRVRNAEGDVKRATGICIAKKYWDAKRRRVKTTHVLHRQHNAALDAQKAKAEKEIAEGVRDVRQAATAVFKTHAMAEALARDVAELEKAGNGHGAAMLRTAAKHLAGYAPNVQAEGMTVRFVQGFMGHLKDEGLGHNSVVSIISRVRACFRRHFPGVVDPFPGAKVGSFRPSGDTPLTREDIGKLWEVKLDARIERIARDAFLFSFFAAGMRFGDVLRLRRDDVGPGGIALSPKKTLHTSGVRVHIPLTEPLRQIVDRQEEGETLFGVLPDGADYKRLQGAQAEINRALKLVALRAGVKAHLKFKLARTTFAHLSQAATGDVYAVGRAMGHTSVKTTEIYLAGLTKDATKAVESVAGLVSSKPGKELSVRRG